MSTAVVYFRLVRVQVRSQMQYRTSFVLSLAGTFLFTTLDLAAILIVFSNVNTLADWSASEVTFLYAASAVSFALADIVLGSLDRLPEMVRSGTLDALLVRPRSAFFQLLSADFLLRRAGRLLQAVLVLAVLAGGPLDLAWTTGRIAVLLVAILSGALILGSIWVMAASVAFWVTETAEFVNAFTSGAAFLAQYPLDIYSQWLRQLVLFILPIGFVIYMPMSWILSKSNGSGLPSIFQFASPLIAVISAVVAAAIWRLAMRQYRSAGG